MAQRRALIEEDEDDEDDEREALKQPLMPRQLNRNQFDISIGPSPPLPQPTISSFPPSVPDAPPFDFSPSSSPIPTAPPAPDFFAPIVPNFTLSPRINSNNDNGPNRAFTANDLQSQASRLRRNVIDRPVQQVVSTGLRSIQVPNRYIQQRQQQETSDMDWNSGGRAIIGGRRTIERGWNQGGNAYYHSPPFLRLQPRLFFPQQQQQRQQQQYHNAYVPTKKYKGRKYSLKY